MVSVTTLKQVALAAVALGTCSVAAPASALTLTFDNAGYASGPYQESGFELNILLGNGGFDPHFGDGTGDSSTFNWHDSGNNGDGAVARLTKIGGGTFDFGGFDLVANYGVFPFTVTSNLGALPNVDSLGSVIANWTGVSYVDFGVPSINYESVGIDNVVVNAAAVPTPALLPGLVGMGIAALRKRKGAVQAESTSEA